MKKTMYVFLALAIMTLAACNETGSAEKAVPAIGNISIPDAGPDQAEPDSEAMTVTYYSLSRSEAPVNGWINKTYTATGYCAEIQAQTFCWSDGQKVLQWVSNNVQYGPLYYNYWGLSTSNNKPQTCHGGCADDYMKAPVFVTNLLLQTLPAADVQKVFDQGTEHQMSCTLSNGNVTCGSIVFTGVQ